MWSEVQADPPVCPGSGEHADPAPVLSDGFPHGRGLCPACSGFFPLRDGTLVQHDAFRGTTDAAEAAGRAEWFNTVGWN